MRSCACAIILSLFLSTPVMAGQVILTMPDEQIQSTLKQTGTWWHAWKDGTTYATDQELAQWVIDRLVQAVSMNHYQSLSELGGTVEIRYDTPQLQVVP